MKGAFAEARDVRGEEGAFARARGVRRGAGAWGVRWVQGAFAGAWGNVFGEFAGARGRVALFLGRSQGGKRRLQGEAAFAGRKGRSQGARNACMIFSQQT